MIKNDFDGFSVNMFLDGDGDWVAHLVELPNVSAFAKTPEKTIAELKTAWKAFKESCDKHGDVIPISPAKKEYSGQFNVRIDKRVHRDLAIEAAMVGLTLNALVAQKLAIVNHGKHFKLLSTKIK